MAVRTLRYNSFALRNWKGATFATDRDALAFLEAAQIYERNQQKAVVDLVRRLKTAGLWSKMKAIYPFVGGTATTHKWNLKDPQDTDAAFRLTFSGGWTHSSTGATPNGTSGYADTFLTPSVSLSSTNCHASIYSRTSTVGTACELGVARQDGSSNNYFFQLRSAANYAVGLADSVVSFTTTSSATGFWIGTSRANNDRKVYRNATGEATSTTTLSSVPNVEYKLALGARANVTSAVYSYVLYSAKELAFATIGDGLTDTDATNLYNIVDLYQKRLGRAV